MTLDRHTLATEYARKGKLPVQIARDFDTTQRRIFELLDEYDISRDEDVPEYPRLRDGEWLRARIVDDGWRVKDIAHEIGCTRATVSRWLNEEHDIDERVGYDYQRSAAGRRWHDNGGFSESTGDEYWRDEFQLRRAYEDYFWSVREIAQFVGTSWDAVAEAMDDCGIDRRRPVETQMAQRRFRGERHPDWLDSDDVPSDKSFSRETTAAMLGTDVVEQSRDDELHWSDVAGD